MITSYYEYLLTLPFRNTHSKIFHFHAVDLCSACNFMKLKNLFVSFFRLDYNYSCFYLVVKERYLLGKIERECDG